MKVTDLVCLKKGTWSPEEDQKLMNYINIYDIWNWTYMPKAAGLSRSGKSCRLRWMNYLRPGLKKETFSREEIETIIELHKSLGNKGSKIAAKLPGRTDNEIKNFWHTHSRKYFKSINPTLPRANHCRPKRFKHKKERVMTEVKFSVSRGAEESNSENSSTITGSTDQFPIIESYSPESDAAFAANDILENVISSAETLPGIHDNLFSGLFGTEDMYLREINSTFVQEAISPFPALEWNAEEFAYAYSVDDELSSFWFDTFLEANYLFC